MHASCSVGRDAARRMAAALVVAAISERLLAAPTPGGPPDHGGVPSPNGEAQALADTTSPDGGVRLAATECAGPDLDRSRRATACC